MKKRTMRGVSAILMVLALTFPAYAGTQGVWAQDKSGRWMYCYLPEEPVKDEWIEDNGKTYYVDSSGYMKTGWVLNQQDGKRYYMGQDGAMCFNTYTPDGQYVGADGSEVKNYDSYRKKVSSSLTSAQNSQWYKNALSLGKQPVFLLADINGDAYKDLILKDGDGTEGHLISISVWDEESKDFLIAADFEVNSAGSLPSDQGSVYLNPENQGIWLEIQSSDGSLQLFRMEDGSPRLEQHWNFTVELDQWNSAEYRVNEDIVTREEWENAQGQALEERGQIPLGGFLTFSEENITKQVNPILTEKELGLWNT